MANSMLCSSLFNIVDPKLWMTIAYCDTASSIWADLKKRYSIANRPLKVSIANCKQGDMDIGEFYLKLVNLWNKLNNLVKVPFCMCSECKFKVASKIVAMYEEDKAHQFLMELNNEASSTIRS